jgi:hypothetical protein
MRTARESGFGRKHGVDTAVMGALRRPDHGRDARATQNMGGTPKPPIYRTGTPTWLRRIARLLGWYAETAP